MSPKSLEIAPISPSQGLVVSADNPETPVLAGFLGFLASEGVTARTARTYIGHIQRFELWLMNQYQAPLLAATNRDLRQYCGVLSSSQRPASVNLALAALRRFYIWAVEAGRADSDPTRKVKSLPEEELSPSGFDNTDRHRIQREAEKAGPVVEAIVALLLNTGLRVSELCSLSWEQVSIRERSGWAQVIGKGNKRRAVPLNLEARQALEAIRPADASGRVFRGKRGPYTARGVRALLADLGRRANVEDVHPHRFRHDCARQMLRSGVDMTSAAKVLGHRRLDTLRIYTQPSAEDLERAVAALEMR